MRVKKSWIKDVCAINNYYSSSDGHCVFVKTTEERVKKWFNNDDTMVLQKQDKVVAYSNFHFNPANKVMWVNAIAVDPKFQGKKYGLRMWKMVLKYAKTLGATSVKLVCRKDLAANKFYKKTMFKHSDNSYYNVWKLWL